MRRTHDTEIAIIGMDCIFPGAADLRAFWQNITAGQEAFTDVPEDRWEPVFYDPTVSGPDRVYCRRGGFIGEYANFDAVSWGVMPVAAEASEPDQLLALDVAARCLRDAGYDDRAFPRETTGVVLGRGGYLNAGQAKLVQSVRTSQELANCLRKLLPDLDEAKIDEIRHEYISKVGRLAPDTVIGLVPNLAASRIANRLDLNGSSYTVDAACASSLIAVERACADLVSGRSDLMLAGGVHVTQDVTFWSVFCQLGALSREQTMRPFDARADGLLIGEGVGMVVLKRLRDAERDGDRIYSVIRGVGSASDGRESSLMIPRVEGQLLALERAWSAAGLDPREPESVGLIEAHGTATPVGDAAELETMARFFGGAVDGEVAPGLGSVKSMIGHTMPAAGIAGVIKASLAVYHGTLPPTLNCEEPHEDLEQSRFRLVTAAEPWPQTSGPRRAAINAFGFGGINGHVILEQHASAPSSAASPIAPVQGATASPELPVALLLAADSPAELLAHLEAGTTGSRSGRCRLALLDPDEKGIEMAKKIVARGKPFHGRKGLWFSPAGLLHDGGKLAFLFPGVEATFEPRLQDVARFFDRPLHPELGTAFDPVDLERTGVGIVLASYFLDGVLQEELGVRPDLVAGNSLGEWSAMVTADLLPKENLDAFLASVGPGTLQVPGMMFAAVGCGVDAVRETIAGIDGVVVSHDNCPHQVVLCGYRASVEEAVERLVAQKVFCQKLDFQSGFHTPFYREYVDAVRANAVRLTTGKAKLPIWSATTCEPYPEELDAVCDLFVEHLLRPVEFRKLTERLYEDGARVFVQVGGGNLPGFVSDTLGSRAHMTISGNDARRAGMEQLRRLVAAVWVEGADVALDRVLRAQERPLVALAAAAQSEDPAKSARAMRVKLGAPMIELDDSHALTRGDAAPPLPLAAQVDVDPDDPVLTAFGENLRALGVSQGEVIEAWAKRRRDGGEDLRVRRAVYRRKLSIDGDPHLVDHSFFPQPQGWPDPRDGFPLVPMTMSLSMMADAAQRLAEEAGLERVVVGLREVRAWRWMAVEEPIEIEIEAKFDGPDRVKVKIGEYIESTVLLAESYPAPRVAAEEAGLVDEAVPIDPATMYADHWMFHGPQYQAVIGFDGFGEKGIQGRIRSLPAEGSLLDGAGQLFGFWISWRSTNDRMALPVMLQSLDFHGPHPAAGEELVCRVFVRRKGKKQVRCDLEISQGGVVWARVEGWEDRRFESDEHLWPVIQFPERNLVSYPVEGVPGCCLLPEGIKTQASRDYFARRYLTGGEMREYRAMKPRRQQSWISGRIAAKDAVRDLLWKQGAGPIYPIEIEIGNDAEGRPFVRTAHASDLCLSISHKDGAAIARASLGTPIGVDLESIEERGAGFEDAAFTEGERALLPVEAQDRSAWISRFWTAKEAVAKRMGTGLAGRPKQFEVRQVRDRRIQVNDTWVRTGREGDYVFAWTEDGDES